MKKGKDEEEKEYCWQNNPNIVTVKRYSSAHPLVCVTVSEEQSNFLNSSGMKHSTQLSNNTNFFMNFVQEPQVCEIPHLSQQIFCY